MSAGFFGKVQSHGDFVGRRLPPDMQQRLDAWLQAALLHSRDQLGAAWVGVWGSSPLWRFALAPGVCGEQGWLGVMMPSADRVGRCFPLVLASAVPTTPVLAHCLGALDGWYGQLEELALSSLDSALSLDVFDAAVMAVAPPVDAWVAAAAPAPFVPTFSAVEPGRLPSLAGVAIDGASAWWTDGSAHVTPTLAYCPGMPPPQGFAAMLDGCWHDRGWRRGE
jgi:type VI secretion system protein ImpM